MSKHTPGPWYFDPKRNGCEHCGGKDLWTERVYNGIRSRRCVACGKLTHVDDRAGS
jgi:hypothetical protein